MAQHQEFPVVDGEKQLEYITTLWRLPEGRLVLKIVRTNYRGVSTSKTYECSPGRALAPMLSDASAWWMQGLVDYFTGVGAS